MLYHTNRILFLCFDVKGGGKKTIVCLLVLRSLAQARRFVLRSFTCPSEPWRRGNEVESLGEVWGVVGCRRQ
jgi:hypothetical protein